MSRIGKKPIILPSGFDATVDAGKVIVKGPKASLTVELPPHATVELGGEPKALTVTVENPENVKQRALWGLHFTPHPSVETSRSIWPTSLRSRSHSCDGSLTS